MAPRTVTIAGQTFAVRPRTLAVDRDLAPLRAELAEVRADKTALGARALNLQQRVDAIADAAELDEAALEEARTSLIAFSADQDALDQREAELLVALLGRLIDLPEDKGNGWLGENLDLAHELPDAMEAVGFSVARPTM